MKRKRRTILLFSVFLLCIALVAAVLFNLDRIMSAINGTPDDGAGDRNDTLDTVYIDGEAYRPKSTVKNYLIIGIDKQGEVDSNGQAQADFILVLSFDSSDNTYTVMPINRDTMTEILVYDVFSGEAKESVAQIALSHNDGTYTEISNTRKCKNTAKAVSNLLYGVEFKNYASMTMDAVGIIVDYVGGVEVYVEYDMTMVDERLVGGQTVLLDGELALKFIGARGGVADETNVSRMERQMAFFDAFIKTAKNAELDEESLLKCFEDVEDYIVTNANDGILGEISDKLENYEKKATVKIPGESKVGQKFMEFHVDEEGLKDIVTDVFYKKTN
ncbi:MAG: LCP family protein [Clostridia bacterium]|nr:LCP family protein [Clostridia bacterium]